MVHVALGIYTTLIASSLRFLQTPLVLPCTVLSFTSYRVRNYVGILASHYLPALRRKQFCLAMYRSMDVTWTGSNGRGGFSSEYRVWLEIHKPTA